MTQWTLAHPWMTLAIILSAFIFLDSAIANICNSIQKVKQMRTIKTVELMKEEARLKSGAQKETGIEKGDEP